MCKLLFNVNIQEVESLVFDFCCMVSFKYNVKNYIKQSENNKTELLDKVTNKKQIYYKYQ